MHEHALTVQNAELPSRNSVGKFLMLLSQLWSTGSDFLACVVSTKATHNSVGTICHGKYITMDLQIR